VVAGRPEARAKHQFALELSTFETAMRIDDLLEGHAIWRCAAE
jgi:hypothetical protein